MAAYYPESDSWQLIKEIARLSRIIKELETGPRIKTIAHSRRAVFFDRDGTVIESVHRPGFAGGTKEVTAPFTRDELKFIPGMTRLMERLTREGFLRIMITNQPDVAHGYLTERVWSQIHSKVVDYLKFDGVYMCRHRGQDNCPRKKPLPGMPFDASDNLGIDLPRSYMVGDTDADMQAGKAAGCRVILIDNFYNKGVEADHRVLNIMEAVDIIINGSGQA